MKKGFTLIELLATLVILGIVAVIGSSAILNVIEDSKSKNRVMMASKVASTMEAFAVNYELENGSPFINKSLVISNKSVQGIDFSLNGTLPDDGLIFVNENGEITVYLYDGKYCVHGTKDDLTSTLGECDYTNSFTLTFSTSTALSVDKQTLTVSISNVISTDVLSATPYSFDGGITWQAGSSYATTNSFQNNICVRNINNKYNCNSLTIYKLSVSASGGILSNMSTTDLFWLEPNDTSTIANPTKIGNTFNGWTLSGTGSSIIGTIFTMGTSATTLTANWTVNSYTLAVDANSGTWSGTTPQTIVYGSTVTIANPTRNGYLFNGWTLSGTGSSIIGTTFTMGSANATLVATWTINSYTLTVNANSGTWSGTTPQTIVLGSTVTIANPTRTNYTFTGWTVSGTGSSIIGTTFTMGTANATLTANWTINSYTLTVDANSGTWSGTTPQTIVSGLTATIAVPTKSSYTFLGWTVSGAGSSISGTTFTMGTANTTITANWVLTTTTFAYTGGLQTFTASVAGNYQIEVWGAQGGAAGSYAGGLGGYSVGQKYLTSGTTLYIYVGGNSTSYGTGGYNGGGSGFLESSTSRYGGAGGGATHVSTVNGLLNSLSSQVSSIIIIAGGGGGGGTGDYNAAGGAGGGTNGRAGGGANPGGGGTQTSGGTGLVAGSFGKGANAISPHWGGGGGGGYYGGGCGQYASAGGGSGYIGGVSSGSMTNGVRTGNGYATITYLGA